MRCARTDKGVHAAGNVISLKLIVEDPDVVAKINAALPAQIRVWDIIRTTGSFSSYQLCDSRKYEYLVPSHVFLPPHPNSYLAKTCLEYAEREGDLEEHLARQKEVADWWPTVNEKVDKILGEDRAAIEKAIEEDNSEDPWQDQIAESARKAVDPLLRKIRDIHTAEKRAYRISPERLERVRDAFGQYVGTHNFYNYTINKTFKDPSAKRHIKTFDASTHLQIRPNSFLTGSSGYRPRHHQRHRMAFAPRAWPILHDAPDPQDGRPGHDGGTHWVPSVSNPGSLYPL